MKSTWDVYRASLSPSSTDHMAVCTRTLTATNSPIATLPASANNKHTNLCENSTPSPSLGLTGATPPSPMPSSAAPNTRLVDGSGYTTPPPLSAKGCEKTPTAKFSKRTVAQLDWTLQDNYRWSLPRDWHPRWTFPRRQAIVPRPPLKFVWPCCQTPRHCSTLQTLCQPVRCRRHPSTSPCRPYAICLTRLCDQVAPLPRHHGRRLHPPPNFN